MHLVSSRSTERVRNEIPNERDPQLVYFLKWVLNSIFVSKTLCICIWPRFITLFLMNNPSSVQLLSDSPSWLNVPVCKVVTENQLFEVDYNIGVNKTDYWWNKDEIHQQPVDGVNAALVEWVSNQSEERSHRVTYIYQLWAVITLCMNQLTWRRRTMVSVIDQVGLLTTK